MYILSTLYALRQYIGLEANDTSEDARLLDALSSASATIEHHTGRSFLPRQESILHTMNRQNRSELLLADDLPTSYHEWRWYSYSFRRCGAGFEWRF